MLTDDLIANIKRRARLPDASDLLDADLLAEANLEVQAWVAAALKTQRGEHWVTTEDQPLVPTQLDYPLPRRCLGRMIRGIGAISTGNVLFHVSEIDVVTGWVGYPTGPNAGIVCGQMSIVGDVLRFPAPPPSGYTLRFWYVRRPAEQLVLSSQVALLDHQASATSLVTSSTPPWANTPRTLLDVVSGDDPHETIAQDLLLSSYSTTTTTLDATTPLPLGSVSDRSAATGRPNARADALCLRDQTCYPQVPHAMTPMLVDAVALRVVESIGGPGDLLASLHASVERHRKAAENVISPRNEAGSRPIRRRGSMLRQTGGIGRRWR